MRARLPLKGLYKVEGPIWVKRLTPFAAKNFALYRSGSECTPYSVPIQACYEGSLRIRERVSVGCTYGVRSTL